MTALQRLLLIPCLSPLLLALLVGGLNLGKSGSLRILTWTLPTMPIGAWMAVAATTGAVLGSGGVLAAGATAAQQSLQREVRRPVDWTSDGTSDGVSRDASQPATNAASMPWPERDVRDPAPTVSVPFRVIRTGRAGSGSAKADPVPQPVANSTPGTPDHPSSAGSSHDWDQPLPTDW